MNTRKLQALRMLMDKINVLRGCNPLSFHEADLNTLEHHAIFKQCRRGECIYDSRWQEKYLYYIVDGLVARQCYQWNSNTQKYNRTLLLVALPGMTLLSTKDLYSDTQLAGEIVALHATALLQFSYASIKQLVHQHPMLLHVLSSCSSKERHQLFLLRRLDRINSLQMRYIEFIKTLPPLHQSLSQQEQQDLLGISRSSIQRASNLYRNDRK